MPGEPYYTLLDTKSAESPSNDKEESMDSASGSKGLLRAFKLALTVDGLRPSTIHHYVRDASRFLDSLDDHCVQEVTRDDVRA